MSGDKLTILILVVSLLIGPSLLGGVDLLARHFCIAGAGGFCGLLQGIAASLNHLSSIQALFIFFAPSLFVLFFISLWIVNAPEIFAFFNESTLVQDSPRVGSGESHWLKIKLNSPNETR